MKKVLIISPYFPPCNMPDMQRIRTSLPYFENYGWQPEIVAVNAKYTDIVQDQLLSESIAPDIKVHYVNAFNKNWTSKAGLGSLALRSLWFYKKKVNRILRHTSFDLIYFSTTQFPVCILGAYWKKKFNIPYVIDMQDPWHSEYYQDASKKRPPKYWLSYRLNKYTEPIAMKSVDGLISVSPNYIEALKNRYETIKNVPAAVITFGAFKPDLELALKNKDRFKNLTDKKFKSIVYIGRGGADMHKALTIVFRAMQKGLAEQPTVFNHLRFYFIGTSYAPSGKGEATVSPLASEFNLQNYVYESTDRISYYYSLNTLLQADALFIPGSDDPQYTASKLYPYLLTTKPLLAIFNALSPAMGVLNEYGAKYVYSFDDSVKAIAGSYAFLIQIAASQLNNQIYNTVAEDKYSARNMTEKQCLLFDRVISAFPKTNIK